MLDTKCVGTAEVANSAAFHRLFELSAKARHPDSGLLRQRVTTKQLSILVRYYNTSCSNNINRHHPYRNTLMASRQALLRSAHMASRATASPTLARSFQTSARFLSEGAAPLPARKPVGAFRGGYVARLAD